MLISIFDPCRDSQIINKSKCGTKSASQLLTLVSPQLCAALYCLHMSNNEASKRMTTSYKCHSKALEVQRYTIMKAHVFIFANPTYCPLIIYF